MDKYYMKLAINLAKKGKGRVNPNPTVGAVIVKENKIIGSGYHEYYGGAHAEVNAFKNAKEEVEGSTLYVTLEPCSHYGSTPPCVDKIIDMKVKKVIIGSADPNPLVSGQGIKKLVEAGIEVVVGILENECKELNEVFMKFIVEKRPFVIMKTAMSLDGKIATKTGESKWITGFQSREKVHQLRNEVSGIMVGVNTVIVDDPELTCRTQNGKSPIRIIIDSKLRIPIDSKVLKNQDIARTIVATTNEADPLKKKELEEKKIKIIFVESLEGRVDLQALMLKLADEKIDSILLEGGSTLNFSALKQSIVDKVQVYIAPKLIGGEMSKTPVGGIGIEKLMSAFHLDNLKHESIGEDILIEGYIRR